MAAHTMIPALKHHHSLPPVHKPCSNSELPQHLRNHNKTSSHALPVGGWCRVDDFDFLDRMSHSAATTTATMTHTTTNTPIMEEAEAAATICALLSLRAT